MKNNHYPTTTTTGLIRWILLTSCALLCLFSVNEKARSSANYTLATTTSGSFTDMSSGTTQIVAADLDDNNGSSTVANLAFAGGDYLATDINGDGFVTTEDVGLADNNNLVFVGTVYPTIIP